MMEYINSLIKKYSNKGIVIDTNLLLLLYIGSVDENLILKFKRTKIFAKEDYNTLNIFLSNFNKKFTTPSILTEVSNLANSLSGNYKNRFFDIFSKGIHLLEEDYMVSKKLATSKEFIRYGLTDTAIIKLINKDYLLLSEDFRLTQYATSLKADVLNFNHIRMINWN